MTDAEIRKRILAALYAVWQKYGFAHQAWVPLKDLVSAFRRADPNIDPVAIWRNADLLAELGMLEKMVTNYRLAAKGVLECEKDNIQPDPVLVERPVSLSPK